ncbi:MAG: hypothetical protein KY476_09625 [Planctomycetes bacterium]|nr:hypothetical protein [Planctomycetota bacterium]
MRISADEARSYIERWKAAAPLLEEIKREELRNFDFDARRSHVAGLLEIAVQHGQPRYTTGLVELRRRLHEVFG